MNLEEATIRELNKSEKDLLYEEVHILEEMASTGPGYKGYRFFVYGGEGNNPHFHLVKDSKTVCCIRLDCVGYWHEEKFPKCDAKLRDLIIKYLKMPYRVKSYNVNNWQYLLNAWNNENDYQIDLNTEMPNYKQLELRK